MPEKDTSLLFMEHTIISRKDTFVSMSFSFIRSSFVRFDIFNFCYLKTLAFQNCVWWIKLMQRSWSEFYSFTSFSFFQLHCYTDLHASCRINVNQYSYSWLTFFSHRLNSGLPSGHLKGFSCRSIMLSLCSLWPPLRLRVFLAKRTNTAKGSGEGEEEGQKHFFW